ncbi:hypothetical protein [Asticcacaulis benevestitus]|uniref:Uncharacterized protein n=1 Tax=Asticcacaulis benevestitus DSM 16100 = ATCC BAA-896 TaxID=1121022 RepID=V4Q448_9CAUL|nr:hypothetical protein [Asticcacaulis benevestitus]ESQ92570.1 hypothetical protein ABENE_07995 [Asticcacaulis benevestitus DSM 16100 = ATCC BAA-896]
MAWERIEDTGKRLRDNPYCYFDSDNGRTYRSASYHMMKEGNIPVNAGFLLSGSDLFLPGYYEQTDLVAYEDIFSGMSGTRVLYDYTIGELGNYREAAGVLVEMSGYTNPPFFITADDDQVEGYLDLLLSFYVARDKISLQPEGVPIRSAWVIKKLIFACRHTGKTIVKHNVESNQYLNLKFKGW